MVHLLKTYGLWLLASLISVECIGIPVPGETTLIASAVYAGTTQKISMLAVWAAAVTGAIVGNAIGFWIGRSVGYHMLLRYGSYLHLTEPRIKIGEYLFRHYGFAVVIAARFVPVARSIAAPLAGANRMPLWSFLVASVIGAVAWVTVIGLAAFYFGHQLKSLSFEARIIAIAIAALVLAAVAILIVRNEKYLQMQAEREIPGHLPAD